MSRVKWIIVCLLALSTQAIAKDTYVVVVDASGSMEERDIPVKGGYMSRMNVAKEALKRVLVNLQGDVDLGIVVFSAGNLQNDWVYPIGRVVREKVAAAIDLPSSYGGTPLGDYIKIGADQLLAKRAKAGNSGRYRLILVTDGESNEGHDPAEWLAEVKRKGIEVDLIGLAMSSEHGLARQVISLPTPGTYQNAASMEQLVEAVANSTKEAPVTASGGIDPVIFEEIAPLPDKVSEAMIKTISYYDNTPIGEQPSTVSVDDQGNIITTSAADEGSNWWMIALGVLVVVVFGVIVIMVLSSL
jgi:uncharacterized protein YegL